METLTIQKCPICGRKHTYYIEVERSLILKWVRPNHEDVEPQRQVKITRIFVCPEKNEEYQASITLFDTADRQIKSIKIVGIKDD
jgi:hypothetical protein